MFVFDSIGHVNRNSHLNYQLVKTHDIATASPFMTLARITSLALKTKIQAPRTHKTGRALLKRFQLPRIPNALIILVEEAITTLVRVGWPGGRKFLDLVS
jgi:hypothetical protein